MKIARDIYLVGNGQIRLSHRIDSHIYLIDGGEEVCLIDVGVGLDTERIVANIRDDGFDPEKIRYAIITHCHGDHAGGAEYFRKKFGVKIFAPTWEADVIENGSKELDRAMELVKYSGIYPPDYVIPKSKVDRVLKHHDTVTVGRYNLKVIQVPGHSPGIAAILLIDGERRALFSTDIVFFGGTIGLGNWPTCSLDDYRENIGRLAGLEVQEMFPGHYLWVLEDGQQHLDKAIEYLKQAWIPPVWSHNHPAA